MDPVTAPIRFPDYRDVNIGDDITITMPAAEWIVLLGWGISIDDKPYQFNAIMSLVLQQILSPREINERLAREHEAESNPFNQMPGPLAHMMRHMGIQFTDPTDPRNGEPDDGTD